MWQALVNRRGGDEPAYPSCALGEPASAAATLAGDLASVDAGMLRLNAFALATWSASDQLVLGGGALTGFSFGSLLALPAAYVEWKPSASWRLEAFVPARRQSIEVTLPAFSRAATAVALRTPSE